MLLSFEDYRDKMLSILDMIEPLLGGGPPHSTEAMDLGRMRMSRILTAYNLFAERELFAPCAAASGDPAYQARVKEISAECASLANAFRIFTRDCAANPVIHRWEEYRVAARAMIVRIRAHLHAAETEVLLCSVEPEQQTFRKAS